MTIEEENERALREAGERGIVQGLGEEQRKGQRRKNRRGRCRRCGGTRKVATGEPAETLMGGEVGTPVKSCSCVEQTKGQNE